MKEQFIFGVFNALEAIPLSLIDTPESFNIETAIQSNEAIDIGESSLFHHIETASGRQRLADVIVHAFEKGYI